MNKNELFIPTLIRVDEGDYIPEIENWPDEHLAKATEIVESVLETPEVLFVGGQSFGNRLEFVVDTKFSWVNSHQITQFKDLVNASPKAEYIIRAINDIEDGRNIHSIGFNLPLFNRYEYEHSGEKR